MYNPYAIGEKIYLRALRQEDVAGPWHEWFSDEEITKHLGGREFPNTMEKQQAFYEAAVNSCTDVVLAVVDKATDKHIGVVSLRKIDWVHRHADIAVVIGNKEFWKSGTSGLEAYTLAIKTAFQRLNLENLIGGYLAGYKSVEKLMELLQFREVGRYKGLCAIDGKREDVVVVQLCRDDWLKRSGGKPGKKAG